jgi:hypothetical protein
MLWLAALTISGYTQDNKIVNDPNARLRAVEGFHGVEVSGSIELYISQGSDTKLALSAKDPADIDLIETVVEDGILRIRYKENKSWLSNQWNTMGRKFRAYVSSPMIDRLGIVGSGGILIQGLLQSSELNIELSGSGNIEGELRVGKLELDQSGSGNIRLKGSATEAVFDCSGSGNVYCPDLVTDNCKFDIAGSGNAEITANKEISVSIAGSGNVRYRGDASIRDISTAGSGKLRKVSAF